ncbi:MAG: hypothetical protein ACRC1G_18300 [Bradyrhizobium sp.]|nr:hypothetical protein [Bradyrhizobium sp.]
MAKNKDHLAGFDADTGGLFSSLLAEEDASDRRRMLWRVATWGSASVAAVALAVMANQSSLGWKREQAAIFDLVQQANRLQAIARENQNEARRLASAVETLNSDRDRLYTRVTVLEQGLDSVTGAIAKQHATAAAAPAPAQPELQPVAAASAAPALTPSPGAAAPAGTAAPAVAAVAAAARPAAPAEKATATVSAEPAPTTTSAVKEVPTKPAAVQASAAAPATALVETKSMMAPPDPAAGKLIEASRPLSSPAAEPILPVVAAAPPGVNENEMAVAALPKIQRTEFGVDVGGANSIAGLRALWRGLLKSRSNAPLAALQPIIVVREGAGGRGMQLRLVAGPLSDAAAAAKICAVVSDNDRDCEPAVYDGQRLSLKGEDAPAAEKPAAPAPSRKRNAPQRRASVEEPARPAPAPATSSFWSSFFSGKKN